jgi:DNA repair protein RecO (recombination protein O)
VLAARRHGESGAVADLFTRTHGRHRGLVRGARQRVLLQAGNGLTAQWRARLPEQLGSYHLEPAEARAGALMEGRDSLAGLNAFTAVSLAALPEHQVHAPLFDAASLLLDAMANEDFSHWAPLYVRWEAGLLEALGFGLDLSACAATGATDDLIYVSPKSGRAVSREPGAPYAQKLLKLPGFLAGSGEVPDSAATRAGLELTGFFLLERVLRPHGQQMPDARLKLDALAAQESK